MGLITAKTVREQAETIAAWPRRRAESEAQRFTDRQPFVSGYVFATLEDEGQEATGFTLQLALTIDKVYQAVLGRPGTRVTAPIMEAAANDAERSFEQLVGVEPELALRRMLFQRDLAEPELLAELMRLMFEETEQDPEIEPAVGATFLALKAVALAYERANTITTGEPKSSLGNALEAQLGRPLPKIGRNDPCPCGSGRKFKKCCGELQAPPSQDEEERGPREEFGDSRTEQRFLQYVDLVGELLMPHFELLCRQRNGSWLRNKSEEFEERFRPGEPDGVPDSLHVGYLLLDLHLPESRKTVAQLFLEREEATLAAPVRRLLLDLIPSYAAFYELVELLPAGGAKRVRELGTGAEWIVGETDDPDGTEGDLGEVWFCRFVGPRDDAITLMTPLVFPPSARDELEELTQELMRPELDAGLSPGDAIQAAMKREVLELAEFLLLSASDLDEEDDDTPSLLDLESEELDEDEPYLCDDPECDEHEHPDTGEIIEEYSRDHYQRWADMPLPALDGATPREAARSREGRARVAALLDEFEEHNESHPASLPPIDVAWLRRELKLDR